MNKMIAVGIGVVVVAVCVLAWMTAPGRADNCTPKLIARYTNVIISQQECVAMPRCIIEPKDIQEFHDAEIQFQQCIIEMVGDALKKTEESKTE